MDPDALIELITCPVCFGLCESPIWQCIHGHVLCDACRKDMEKNNAVVSWDRQGTIINCPTCRAPCGLWSRNLSLEKVAETVLGAHEYPCPNDCGTTVTYGHSAKHIAECRSGGVTCLVAECEIRVPKVTLDCHVATHHSALITTVSASVNGVPVKLNNLAPMEFTAFSPKNSSLGHYLFCVVDYGKNLTVASWILVKRHRKSHIEIGMECLRVTNGYEHLVYVLSASTATGCAMQMEMTAMNAPRIRDEQRRGIVIKDSPAYTMTMFHVDARYQSSLRLHVLDKTPHEDTGLPPRKRARTDDDDI